LTWAVVGNGDHNGAPTEIRGQPVIYPVSPVRGAKRTLNERSSSNWQVLANGKNQKGAPAPAADYYDWRLATGDWRWRWRWRALFTVHYCALRVARCALRVANRRNGTQGALKKKPTDLGVYLIKFRETNQPQMFFSLKFL
jgi:hypothetical protein